MNTDNAALTYYLQKIFYKFVKNLVDKNVSLEDVLKELKAVGLERTNTNIKKVEEYVQKYLGMEWNAEKKKWKKAAQVSMLLEEHKVDLETLWSNPISSLSENDKKTMLKDMKEILSSAKKITKDINKVVGGINVIIASIDSNSK